MNLKRKLKQKAVYFAPKGTSPGGTVTYQPPVQIKCRWEDVVDVTIANPNAPGEEISPRSSIMSDVKMVEQGVLWLGEFKNLTDLVKPFNNPNAQAIITVEAIPTVNGKQTVYTAYT